MAHNSCNDLLTFSGSARAGGPGVDGRLAGRFDAMLSSAGGRGEPSESRNVAIGPVDHAEAGSAVAPKRTLGPSVLTDRMDAPSARVHLEVLYDEVAEDFPQSVSSRVAPSGKGRCGLVAVSNRTAPRMGRTRSLRAPQGARADRLSV